MYTMVRSLTNEIMTQILKKTDKNTKACNMGATPILAKRYS